MTQEITRYLLELTACLGGFALLYAWWVQPVGSFRSRRFYLVLMPILALLIPILEYMVPSRETGEMLESVGRALGGTFDNLLPRYLSGFELKVLDIFLLLLFGGWCLGLFRLGDQLARQTAQYGWSWRQPHFWQLAALQPGVGMDRLCLESLKVVLWWHPLIYYFDRQWWSLISTDTAAVAGSARKVYGFAALALALMMGLFSFNAADKLAERSTLPAVGAWLDRHGDQTLWVVEEAPPTAQSLKWGIKLLPLVSPEAATTIDYSIALVHPKLFYTLQYTLPAMNGNRHTPQIKTFRARIALPNTPQLLEFNDLKSFETGLKNLGEVPECTIYLEILDEQQRPWFAACTVSESGQVYGQEQAVKAFSRELAGLDWHFIFPKPSDVLFQPDSCIIRWGDLKVDLKKYANPNVYSGFLELKKEQVLPFLEKEIQVFQNGETLPITDLTLRYYDKTQNDVINLELELNGDRAAIRLPRKTRMLSEMLKQGDAITIYGKVGEITLNAVSIRIYNPNSLYEPKVWINNWKKPDTTYGFQVISREGFKTRLRIDTSNTAVKHILDLYQDRERYDIIHIPGFETYQRLLHSDAQSFAIEAIQKYPDRDWWYRDQLPEQLDYVNHLVQLRWGDLFAMPNSEIYSPQEFFNNMEQPIELWFDREQQTVLRLAVAIIPNEGPTDYLLLDREQLAYLGQMEAIRSIQPATSLFISGITILDDQGQELSFPENFMIHIGHSLESKNLTLQTTVLDEAPDKAPEMSWADGRLEFRNYPLTELIGLLVDRKLNRIEFEGLETDPFLDVVFEGAGYDEMDATRMVLNALQKKFHFSTAIEGLQRDNFRIQVMDEPKLEAARFTDEIDQGDRIKIFDRKGFHLLSGITIGELADYLEDELDIIITVFPFYDTEDRYIFGLDFSSLTSVREQLKSEYGIQLWEHDFLFNGVRVQFGGAF